MRQRYLMSSQPSEYRVYADIRNRVHVYSRPYLKASKLTGPLFFLPEAGFIFASTFFSQSQKYVC